MFCIREEKRFTNKSINKCILFVGWDVCLYFENNDPQAQRRFPVLAAPGTYQLVNNIDYFLRE